MCFPVYFSFRILLSFVRLASAGLAKRFCAQVALLSVA